MKHVHGNLELSTINTESEKSWLCLLSSMMYANLLLSVSENIKIRNELKPKDFLNTLSLGKSKQLRKTEKMKNWYASSMYSIFSLVFNSCDLKKETRWILCMEE